MFWYVSGSISNLSGLVFLNKNIIKGFYFFLIERLILDTKVINTLYLPQKLAIYNN